MPPIPRINGIQVNRRFQPKSAGFVKAIGCSFVLSGKSRCVVECSACGGYGTVLEGNIRDAKNPSCGCRKGGPKKIPRKTRLVSGIRVVDDKRNVAFGNLTIVGARFMVGRDSMCVIHCSLCDEHKITRYDHAKSQDGCGCLKGRWSHRLSHTPEYKIYLGMLDRCTNESCPHYKNYGGRGIYIVDRWLGSNGFGNFYSDKAPRPTPQHSIDRIDNSGPYSPENTKWSTMKEQCNNRRSTVLLTFYGKTMSMREWSKISGVSDKRIGRRIKDGWSEKAAVWTPIGYKPQNQSLPES